MISLCLVVFIASFVFVLILQKRNQRNQLPPGPSPWPLIGNLIQIDEKDPRKTFCKWRQLYGPVYTIWSGSEAQVLVCESKIMQDTFNKCAEYCTDRPSNWIFEYLLKGKCGIVFASGDCWKEQRRFTLQTLKNFGVGRKLMEEKILSEIIILLQSADELATATTVDVNLDEDLELCVGNVISSLLVGRTYLKNDPIFRTLKSSLNHMFKLVFSFKFVALLYFRWLRFVPFFGHFGLDEITSTNETIIAIIRNELENHKDEINFDEEPTDFTFAYLKEIKRRKENNESLSYFNEWQLICTTFDLWVAGMETTVPTVRWSLLLMIKYPEYQEKVRNEIDHIIGTERSPTMADKNSMIYTQAVLNEIQRFANIVPANFPRVVTKDGLLVDGHTVPKGTTILPQISVTNNDESWFENPSKFDPNHFLEPDGTLRKVDGFLPFSVGKRSCLGEGLARMELFLIFTSILQRYTLSIPAGHPEPTLEPIMRFVMEPYHYNCCIKRRTSN